MSMTTYTCVIENGQVRLPAGIVLSERQTVLVLVPDGGDQAIPKLPHIRLADPKDATKFEMKVTWGEQP
ncbi:MAG: hypothetical protein ACRC8S_01390 [Fimbriiglobus sp.]